MTLDQLRGQLTETDDALIALIAERQRIVAKIGAHKIDNGIPTRDYEREREVLKGARERARSGGLDPDLAEEIMTVLIRSSLAHQERTRVRAASSGVGKRAIVIGGAGKMGAWFVDFLTTQGYAVRIADPAATSPGSVADWQTLEIDDDLVIVATPMARAAAVLSELARRRPAGLIMDLGSLKTPLRESLAELAAAGCKVCSIHPMFGPDTRLLSGRHVIFVDVGSSDGTREARAIFASTMAELVEMSVDEHDRLVAYVLGLSHALNIAFFTALAESGELVPKLKNMSSTTFDAQLDVASLVAHDNPRLYFEIQRLNEFGSTSLQALKEATKKIIDLVGTGDEEGFVQLMEAWRKALEKGD